MASAVVEGSVAYVEAVGALWVSAMGVCGESVSGVVGAGVSEAVDVEVAECCVSSALGAASAAVDDDDLENQPML